MTLKTKLNYLLNDIGSLFRKNGVPNHYSQAQLTKFSNDIARAYRAGRNLNQRQYDAASVSRLRDWSASSEDQYNELNRDIPILIARSKDQIKNNAIAKSIINIYDSQIVANGLRVTPRPLGKNGEIDEALQAKIAGYWERFVDECSLNGFTMYEEQVAALNSMITTGGTFLNLVNAPNTQIGFKLQTVDQSWLDYSCYKNKNICCGIELNTLNQPVNFNFRNGVVLPASKLTHSYRLIESGQFIGIPWLSSTLPLLYDVNELIQNVSIASQIQSSISLWIPKSQNDGFPSANDIDDSDNVNLEPGSIFRTSTKPELIQANDQVSRVVEPLLKVLLHQIAVSQGFSYGLLIRDLNNSNYSASRQNSQEDRRYFTTIQKMFAKRYVKPIYDAFVRQLIVKGLINASGVNEDNLWKICECSMSTDAFSYLNPLDEVNADILRLQNGLVSLQTLYNEKGQDYLKNLKQIAKEKKEMEELGLHMKGEPAITGVNNNDNAK